MLKGDSDKVTDALSSTLSAKDMKYIKVDGNLIQFVPKGPKFSMDKIPLNDPDFQESDEWKTTLTSIQYFLNKIDQERENNAAANSQVEQEEKPKKQRKRRSNNKKPIDQEDVPALTDNDQTVPQQAEASNNSKNKKKNKKRSKKPAAAATNDGNSEIPATNGQDQEAKSEPNGPENKKSPSSSRKKRSANKKAVSDQQVPDQMETTTAETSRPIAEAVPQDNNATAVGTKSNSPPAKTVKKKRSKRNQTLQQEEEVVVEPKSTLNEEGTSHEEETMAKRKTKRALPKLDPHRKAQILESDVFDYSELEDVLTAPALPTSNHLPMFAPDQKKVVTEGRIANKNKPTPKNKHAEVPPPSFLTTTSKPKTSKPTVTRKRKLKLSPTESLIKSLRTDLSLNEKSSGTDVTQKLDQLLMNPKNKRYFDEMDLIVSKGRRLFPPYLKPDLIPYLVEQKILLQGYIHISRKNAREAWVIVDESDTDAFVYGSINRNRAMDGDRVVIIPVDSEQVWEKKLADGLNKAGSKKKKKKVTEPEEVVEDDGLDDSYEDIDDDDEEELERQGLGVSGEEIEEEEEEEEVEVVAPPALCGRVVYIYPSKEKREYPGTVILNRGGKTLGKDLSNLPGVVWFKPINKRVPLVMLKSASLVSFFEKKKLNPAENNVLKAKMQYWSPNHTTPLGGLSGYIGHEDTLPTQCKSILLDSNIADEEFSAKILGSIKEKPRDKSSNRRKDFRDKRIFTIDPATAKDLDDALHVEKISDDEYEVGVHIADVSHFVGTSSTLDTSAFNRGTSVYLCDRVIPMFPFQLSEEKCSLNPNEDRLTFSVIWRVDSEGNVKSTEFTESTIRSCAKLAYDDAQNVIETGKLPKDLVLEKGVDREGVEQDITYLANLARKMRQRRFDTGSLSINSITLYFEMDESGKPIGVSIYQQKEANKVIEEFMLLANRSVAEKLYQVYPEEALLRQHGPPKEKALNKFLKIADSLGYPLDGSSAGALQASLNTIKSEHVKQVLEILAAKPMQRAKYFCAGTPKVAKFHHYALNIPRYTHFTSPIRRFADVVVHRQLKAALSKRASSGYTREKVEDIAHQCNDKKESAKNVEDDTKRVYLAYYLDMLEKKQEKPIKCTGIITSLDKEAIEVLVPEYGIEKRIFMDALPLKRFVFNSKNFSLNAYWKAGVEVNLEFAEARKAIPLEDLPQGSELYKDKRIAVTPELLAEQDIDKDTLMQRFRVLGEIEVRLQTDLERSPPATFVFPVNPF